MQRELLVLRPVAMGTLEMRLGVCRAHPMQGLIIHGKKLCLHPKSSGSHGRVRQNGEIGL